MSNRIRIRIPEKKARFEPRTGSCPRCAGFRIFDSGYPLHSLDEFRRTSGAAPARVNDFQQHLLHGRGLERRPTASK